MKTRFLLNELIEHSKKKEITLLLGARQTGKTTLLKQLQKRLSSEYNVFITLEDKTYLKAFNQHPKNLLQFIPPLVKNKKNYILIDEIQYLDDPSNFLKLLYDEYGEQIKLIVSGSSGFYIDKKFTDSLAGRKRIFELSTMGFKEFLYFKGYENFSNYAHSDHLPKMYLKELQFLLTEYIIYGGYPLVVLQDLVDEKKQVLKELATSYIKKDVLDASVRYQDIYFKLMKIASAQIGSLFNLNTISKNLKINIKTVESYLFVMQKSFHISLVKPFYKNNNAELRKMKKIYFNDLGLRNYFINDFNPLLIRADRGNLLENYLYLFFCSHYERDNIYYWRTQKKQEVDFVIEESKAYEVKFSDSSLKKSKYTLFKNTYPKIPLKFISFDNVLELNLPVS
ncbi:MAG: ATP-binding protein [Candidatus Marinimicrobia bacterium]|nr:ATP-binding protein [Candidatus Neomarinimicrobiota bacterium]